jgi:hypothetical protein
MLRNLEDRGADKGSVMDASRGDKELPGRAIRSRGDVGILEARDREGVMCRRILEKYEGGYKWYEDDAFEYKLLLSIAVALCVLYFCVTTWK